MREQDSAGGMGQEAGSNSSGRGYWTHLIIGATSGGERLNTGLEY